MGRLGRQCKLTNVTNGLTPDLIFLDPVDVPQALLAHMSEYTEPPFAEALEAIKSRLPERLQNPLVGIVCGSGLGGMVDCIRDLVLVPYSTVPGFADSTGEQVAQRSLQSYKYSLQCRATRALWRSVSWAMMARTCPSSPCLVAYVHSLDPHGRTVTGSAVPPI